MDTEALASAMQDRPFSGVVTVDVGEERAFEACVGHAHRALAVPTVRETRFALASGSKVMTALGILRLVEEGRLALADPVRPLLGDDLPLIDDAVTVEHLLGHTSGIGDYLDEEADWDAADYVLPVPVHTLAETEAFVPVVDGYPQVSPPGERFAYNNGGYIVLAVIIDRLADAGFHDWVETQVCAGRTDQHELSAVR